MEEDDPEMKTNTPEDAEALIQKLSSDMGIHRNPRKGTLNAPEEILESMEFDEQIFVSEIFPDEFSLEKTHDRISSNTEDILDYGRPLVSIGGDHSVTFPVLEALKEKFPDMKLVWLDSHLDLKEKVDGHVSHDVVVRELVEKEIFRPEEIVFVGVTRTDHDEEKFLDEHDIQIYRPEEVDLFLDEWSSGEACYLSVDIDVLEESEAPGTGYPDGQLSVQEVEKVIEKTSPRYSDIVEVAPSLDREKVTVENARKILSLLVSEATD
ncbi:arginase family protein [Candidatus Nanosalina sp. VS9-1]|uniref:arginase family protein n=1 Tax=Candidatus Nanosalina sp. VS9-1 TaxID=3388566 RepID=UPI0039E0F255